VATGIGETVKVLWTTTTPEGTLAVSTAPEVSTASDEAATDSAPTTSLTGEEVTAPKLSMDGVGTAVSV